MCDFTVVYNTKYENLHSPFNRCSYCKKPEITYLGTKQTRKVKIKYKECLVLSVNSYTVVLHWRRTDSKAEVEMKGTGIITAGTGLWALSLALV